MIFNCSSVIFEKDKNPLISDRIFCEENWKIGNIMRLTNKRSTHHCYCFCWIAVNKQKSIIKYITINKYEWLNKFGMISKLQIALTPPAPVSVLFTQWFRAWYHCKLYHSTNLLLIIYEGAAQFCSSYIWYDGMHITI